LGTSEPNFDPKAATPSDDTRKRGGAGRFPAQFALPCVTIVARSIITVVM
jgi:hypothetical protein